MSYCLSERIAIVEAYVCSSPFTETRVESSHDVWQFAIVMFVCLTGCLPWQKAAFEDPRYTRYLQWQASSGVLMPVRRPKLFKLLSARAQRCVRKFLEPRSEKRPQRLTELARYLDDRWLAKTSSQRQSEFGVDDDGLCPSMYSFHSSADEKNKLLATLTEYGIETTVDRVAKKDRIRQWIQTSVISEEEEEEAQQQTSAPQQYQHQRLLNQRSMMIQEGSSTGTGSRSASN